MEERVVITGIGAVSPLGLSVDETWNNLISGKSGVGPLTLFDASSFQVSISAEIKGFKPENYMENKEARRYDRYEQLALAAAHEAILQAGILEKDIPNFPPERIGVVISSAVGGLTILHDSIYTVRDQGPRRLSPFAIPALMANGASGLVSIKYGFQGPSMSVASACASGSDGIGIAWMMLKMGLVDIVITGGSDATITPVAVGSFDRLGAMSHRNSPDINGIYSTPRPFDRNRDGLVIGEGSGIIVLETESNARKRGVQILAELAGYAASADAFHITAPSEDGSGGSKAMRKALESGKINTDEVDYINAHGTATYLNDLSETRAIKSTFGELAYHIPISSTKSMTGHIMGATGALELIFCTCVIRDQILPPTINYETYDPDCDLDYVPNIAREKKVNIAMSNAFGFGGHNSVLIIKKYK